MALVMSFVNHGRFFLLDRGFFGMQRSMISMYLASQLATDSFISPVSSESQVVASMREQALVKSAWAYFQIALFPLLLAVDLLVSFQFILS